MTMTFISRLEGVPGGVKILREQLAEGVGMKLQRRLDQEKVRCELRPRATAKATRHAKRRQRTLFHEQLVEGISDFFLSRKELRKKLARRDHRKSGGIRGMSLNFSSPPLEMSPALS